MPKSEVLISNSVLVVYNTCGISGRDNTDYYIFCLQKLLNQDFPEFHVVLSDCCTSPVLRDKVVSHFGSLISYNFVDDRLPLNVTVNSTVGLCVDHFGEFGAYLYVDSGVDADNPTTISELWKLLRSNSSYGMAASQVDIDNGYALWQIDPSLIVIPVGKTVNLHCQLYSSEYFRAYNRKLLPDIFASDTHESIYTYLTAAINLQFVVHPTLVLHHAQGVDGPSVGFRRGISLFKETKHIDQICIEGHPLGFGYEEHCGRCVHRQDLYKDNVTLLNPEPLHQFLLENVFLSPAVFDYKAINQNFVPNYTSRQ